MNSMDNPEYRKQREKNNTRAMELKKDFISIPNQEYTLKEIAIIYNILGKRSAEEKI